MDHWLHHTEWLGNPTLSWVIAAIGALLGYLLAHGFARAIRAHLRKLAKRTHRPGPQLAADVAAATRGWLLLLIAIVVALDFLQFEEPVPRWLALLTLALVGAQFAYWLAALVVGFLHQAAERNAEHPVNGVMFGIITWAAQFAIWVTLLLLVLSFGGIQITALVASLGVGGVAVALAAQTVLGDLFASISIGLDKPFEVGEFIAFGSDLGTVTKVGIKSTRIQSLSGEELAISNSRLLQNLIHNYSRMQQRRVVFGFTVPYGTPAESLKAIVDGTRTAITDEDKTQLDRGHFLAFGESGFKFEFVYYVLDPGYTLYCDIQQRINLAVMARLEELEVRFATPARTVHVLEGGNAAAIAQPTSPN